MSWKEDFDTVTANADDAAEAADKEWDAAEGEGAAVPYQAALVLATLAVEQRLAALAIVLRGAVELVEEGFRRAGGGS